MGKIKLRDKLNFSVPTGNFGDILAGYYAKRLGLPVGALICASNQNNVLSDFISTGVYDKRREFYKTNSPSMDILVSSNLERLLNLLSLDEEKVAGYMADLNEKGIYSIDGEMLAKLKEEFSCGYCSDEDSLSTIGDVFKKYNYLMDPHTAVAWNVSDKFMAELTGPTVVLSTASPYKFPAACLKAIGVEPDADEFRVMEQLNEVSSVPVPPALAALKDAPVLHTDVIEKDEMLSYVLNYLNQ